MSNDYSSEEYWKGRMDGKESLYLYYDNIGVRGAKALADALRTNTSLQWLYLGNNNIGVRGAKALADALRTNTSLRVLYLYSNNIGDEGAKALADALGVNTSLQRLDLDRNNIGDSGAKTLADALGANTSLQWLYLYNNNIDNNLRDEIDEKLRRNRRFHALKESKYIEKRSVLQTFLTTYLLHDFIDELMIWRGEKIGDKGDKIYDFEVWKEWKM